MSKKSKSYILLMCSSLLMGFLGGITGTLFFYSINLVTAIRTQNGFLIFFLPLGAVLTVLIYKLLRVEGISTNSVFNAAKNNALLSSKLAPAIFIASSITHLFGGSAGREGASLQIGGSCSVIISRLFKLSEQHRKILVLCGMASVFSAVFSTPLTAVIFVFEVTEKIKTAYKSIFPVFISSISAFAVSRLLKVTGEGFALPPFEFDLMAFSKTIIIAGLCGIICYAFCVSLYFSKKVFKLINNPYVRAVSGAAIIIAITLLIGNQDYNGTGSHIIARIFEGENITPYSFLLKIILTALTVGAGFKGGEIVPAFFIGATFGSTAASLLGLPLSLGAAIGMVVLFAGSTKCPLAALIIAFELFGVSVISTFYLLVSVIVGFVFSGDASLYCNPKSTGIFKFRFINREDNSHNENFKY